MITIGVVVVLSVIFVVTVWGLFDKVDEVIHKLEHHNKRLKELENEIERLASGSVLRSKPVVGTYSDWLNRINKKMG
jgi:predicted PurR-regulated permease PerM